MYTNTYIYNHTCISGCTRNRGRSRIELETRLCRGSGYTGGQVGPGPEKALDPGLPGAPVNPGCGVFCVPRTKSTVYRSPAVRNEHAAS